MLCDTEIIKVLQLLLMPKSKAFNFCCLQDIQIESTRTGLQNGSGRSELKTWSESLVQVVVETLGI